MSSAILYLAIIAIWACVLVPRWVRKPHRVPEADELPGLKYVGTPGQAGSGHAGAASVSGTAPPASWASAGAVASAGAGVGADGSAGAEVDGGAGAGADGGTGAAAGAAWDEDGDTTEVPPPTVEEGVAWHRVTQRRSYRTEHQASQGSPAHQPPERAHILQARRRLLTMLVTLTVAALACTGAKLTPWWILVPPAGLLGMYLLLLREAAHADAEQARWLAQERAARSEAAELHAGEAREAGEAQVASPPRPAAEIIDISARVTDQLYDQYADAVVRAVGD